MIIIKSYYQERQEIYERALKFLPACYKLWYNYLLESMENYKNVCIIAKVFDDINHLYQRALIYMSKVKLFNIISIYINS